MNQDVPSGIIVELDSFDLLPSRFFGALDVGRSFGQKRDVGFLGRRHGEDDSDFSTDVDPVVLCLAGMKCWKVWMGYGKT